MTIEFYQKVADKNWFSGKRYEEVIAGFVEDPNGKTPEKAFKAFDDMGRRLPCIDLQKLGKLLLAKAAVNLQIKMWAQGMAEGTLIPFELREWLTDLSAPEWVYKAVVNQAKKSDIKPIDPDHMA